MGSGPQTGAPRNGLSHLLVVDPAAAQYLPVLRGSYRVTTTSSAKIALEELARIAPAAIVTELNLPDGSGLDLCAQARGIVSRPAVLVTTSEAERVPDALITGCDAVLLKPFAPNLIYSRLGRLLRARAAMVRSRAQQRRAKVAHLADRSDRLLAGCNRVWPTTHCAYCGHAGVTSFEYASHRQAWYACLECRKVWLARRRD